MLLIQIFVIGHILVPSIDQKLKITKMFKIEANSIVVFFPIVPKTIETMGVLILFFVTKCCLLHSTKYL